MNQLGQVPILNRISDICRRDSEILAAADELTYSGKIGNAVASTKSLSSTVLEARDLTQAKQLVLAALLTQTTRDKIGKLSPELTISSKNLKEFCLAKCQESSTNAGLNFQPDMNGPIFYQETLDEESKAIRSSFDEITDYRIKNLCLKFQHLSPNIEALVYLLFSLMAQDSHQRIETIKYWLKNFEKKPDNLRLLQNFLGVYGDISQHVHESNAKGGEIKAKSRLVLAGVLEDRRLANSDNFNPFEVLKEYLSESGITNPWIQSEAENSPFDAYRIGDLLDPEVPRKLLAMSAAGLNQPGLEVLSQKSTVVLRQYKAYQQLKRSEKTEDASLLKPKLIKSLDEIITAYCRETKSDDTSGSEVSQKVAFIKSKILAKAQWITTEIQGNMGDISTFHPLMVMIRLIDPEKVVNNTSAGRQLRTMIQGIESFIEKLYQLDSSEQEQCGAALARSIELLLNSGDPYLDVPLKPDYKVTIRELMVQHIVRYLPEDIRENGAYARFKDKSIIQLDHSGPLVTPPDKALRTPNHFNSAMLGNERTWITRAAMAWIASENHAIGAGRTFEKMLRLATETLTKYYKARTFQTHFYSSATVAAIDVFPKLALAEAEASDYIIGSNQEYGAMVDEAVKVLDRSAPRNDKKQRAEFIELNHTNGSAKTAESLYEDIQTIIRERGQPPRLIMFSSKTRYGDAPAIDERPGKENYFVLTDLMALIRKEWPEICIVLDGCQSFGRNDVGEDLDAMKPDLYFNSSAKALGGPNCGILMIREDFEGYPEQPKGKEDLKGTRSTIDLPSVVATTLALRTRMGRLNPWFNPVLIPEGNSLRVVESDRLIELTEYILGKLQSLPDTLIKAVGGLHKNLDEDVIKAVINDALAIQIAYPTHKKRRDFNGIVTFGVPGIRGERLNSLLAEALTPNTVTNCLRQGDAIRASVLPHHTEADIDVLIDAIKNSFLDKFKRQMRNVNPQNKLKSKEDFEIWLNQKMHRLPKWEH